tara:strand:+ start:207 stop:374 length:168 start_codon:yes stop_codon:yes gene_type:complete
MMNDFTEMDWVRAAIVNAYEEGMTVEDLLQMVANAETGEDFDEAVNLLTYTMPAI